MSWSDELGIYTKVCEELSAAGVEVLWKEHPKAERAFFAALPSGLGIHAAVPPGLHFSWPIEVLAGQLKLSACISATSTSLFTLSDAWSIPIYSFAKRFTSSQLGVHAEGARLVCDHVDTLESLLAGHRAETGSATTKFAAAG